MPSRDTGVVMVAYAPFVLLLLSAYSLGTLVFGPSRPPARGTFHMSFLDALYMCITGTTIGFGEFPVPFNAALLAWICVGLCALGGGVLAVICRWLY